MKPIKRKNLMGMVGLITFLLVVIAAFLAVDNNKLDHQAFFIPATIVMVISAVVFLFIMFKCPANEPTAQNGFDVEAVHVGRSREGTLFEIASGLLVIVAWVIALASHLFFGTDGSVNYSLIFTWSIITLMVAILLIQVYKPGAIAEMGQLTNMKQVRIAIRACRILALVLALALVAYCISVKLNLIIDGRLSTLFLVYFIVVKILLDKAK